MAQGKKHLKKSSSAASCLPVAAAILTERPARVVMAASTQTTQDPEPAIVSSTADIIAAINASTEKLTTKIDGMATEISIIRTDLDKFRSRMAEAEHRISEVEDTVHTDSREIKALQIQVKALQDRAIDAENRMRRNNIRILGLPERAEGSKAAEFAEQLLLSLFKWDQPSPTFVVERAHRVPPRPPPPGAPPRPFLMRLLNYRDRDRVLAAARTTPELKYENAKLMIFPDYSQEIQQRRKSYAEVRKRLRDRNLRFGLLYPSKMRVVDGDQVRFFDTPEAVSEWLDNRR